MSWSEIVNHDAWGKKLSDHRHLEGFSAYGAEMALHELAKAWNRFLFTRDAREVAFTPRRLQALADEVYKHNLDGELKIPYVQFGDPRRAISPREEKAWFRGFLEAYKEALEDAMADVIPQAIADKLGLFCDVVGAIQRDVEAGHEPGSFGPRMGAKKVREEVKIHPVGKEIVRRAREEGLAEGKLTWGWQVDGETSIRRPMYVSTPFDWQLTPEEEELYHEEYEKAFLDYVGRQIKKIAPPKAWENAFLICSLYHEMEIQKAEGRRTSRDRGWYYLKSLREEQDRLFKEQEERDQKAQEAWRAKFTR